MIAEWDGVGQEAERGACGYGERGGTMTDSRIVWDYNIPLVTNRFIMLDMAKVLVISFAIVSAMFMLIGICQGVDEFFELLPLISLFAICTLVLCAIFLFVMLIIYRNRFPCRFTVDSKGVSYEVTSAQKVANLAVIVLGLVTVKPGMAGAGFLARAQESVFYDWASIHRVDVFPKRRVVCIRNSWRTLLRVYCTPENYNAVADMALDGVKRAEAVREDRIARARKSRSAMLKRVVWLPLVLISAVLCTAQPLLDGQFGLVWLAAAVLALSVICAGPARRVMGIVGALLVVGVALVVVHNGLAETSYANGLIHWNAFRTATDQDDLPFFVTGCVGALGLLALSVRSILTGKTG